MAENLRCMQHLDKNSMEQLWYYCSIIRIHGRSRLISMVHRIKFFFKKLVDTINKDEFKAKLDSFKPALQVKAP